MHPPKPLFGALLCWAKRSFEEEVIEDFRRANSFDGYEPKLAVKALRVFPLEKLRLFAHALPKSLWASHPESAKLIEISASDQQATQEFQQAVHRLRQQEWLEFSNHIARKLRPETLSEAKRIRMVGLGVIKEFADKSEYNLQRIDSQVWRLSSFKIWGTISADISFESPLELSYAIFIHDTKGIPLRQGDHYLGVLGIASSSWSIINAEECREKILSACAFIHWHLNEYVRLMDALGMDDVPHL